MAADFGKAIREGAINALAKEVHDTAVEKGFYDRREPPTPERLMLMVSELAEAMEADRHGNPPSEKIPQFSGIEEELADCLIRILDFSHQRGFNIGEAVLAKMAYNKTRPHRHGGKKY